MTRAAEDPKWLEQQRLDAGLRSPVRKFQELDKTVARGEPTPYEELLSTVEWLIRRHEILERDQFRCTACSRMGSVLKLQVHHKYYVRDWLPWEYPDEALQTLCRNCHTSFHLTKRVAVFESRDGRLVKTFLCACPRCGGIGFIPQYEHIEAGICFRCRGACFEKGPSDG